MRLGEDPTKLLPILSEPTAADILGLTANTIPVEKGMSLTVEYYANLPSEKRQEILDFYYNDATRIFEAPE